MFPLKKCKNQNHPTIWRQAIDSLEKHQEKCIENETFGTKPKKKRKRKENGTEIGIQKCNAQAHQDQENNITSK